MQQHVVWDWNGTLFDDQHLVLEGLNAVLEDAGMDPIGLDTYRRLYTRPVRLFYERLFGRPIDDAAWAHLDEVYHAGYRAALHRAGLADDAAAALETAASDGSQSLLSMWRHAELVPLVDRLGIAAHFVRIDGVKGPGGGMKAPYLEAHLANLGERLHSPSQVLVVGDALDDAAAAMAVGARCVLYDGGAHPREHLEATGVPVADTLLDAVELGRS